MAAYIALLRAINVSGTGSLPMKELRGACEAAGLRQVSTYIASGNVVFASDDPAPAVKAIVAGVLRDRFGLTRNHTIIRTPDDLARVIAGNPFPDAAAERPSLMLVNALDGLPPPDAASRLAAYDGPERFHLDGEHLYVDFVESIGRSKLTPAFLDRALQVPSTGRNWNTMRKLLDMARAIEA